jgi:hypothetical protein
LLLVEGAWDLARQAPASRLGVHPDPQTKRTSDSRHAPDADRRLCHWRRCGRSRLWRFRLRPCCPEWLVDSTQSTTYLARILVLPSTSCSRIAPNMPNRTGRRELNDAGRTSVEPPLQILAESYLPRNQFQWLTFVLGQIAPSQITKAFRCLASHSEFFGDFNPNANPRSIRLLRIFKYLAVPGSLVSCCKYSLLPLCHGRGREFESRRPRHSFQEITGKDWLPQ